MPFKVPSLAEVNRTVENNFSQAFYGSSGVLRAMVLKVVSKVVAGAVYMAVLFLSFIWKNSFVATADVDGLVRIGALRNMTPKPASPARGMIEISGPEGTSISAGTVVVDEVFGNEYEILNSVTINEVNDQTGLGTVAVQAYSIGFGSKYDLSENTVLTFRDIDIEDVTIKVAEGGLYGGVSVDVVVDGVEKQWGETVEDYRNRLKKRVQNQTAGGNDVDYWEWAMSFSEVSDCFVVPNYLVTNIVLIFCADFRSPVIKLNQVILDKISDYICSNDRRPAAAYPFVSNVEPIRVSFVVAIQRLNDFYKNSIVEAVKSYFRTVGPNQSFSAESIRQAILANGGVSEAVVSGFQVKGTSVAGAYTLQIDHTGSTIEDIVFTGEVVDTNNLYSDIEFISSS
jgi:uncharacterized phage protein gp47/JayE